MPGFLSAHGYDPGPTQRPVLAGTLAAIFATLPAVAPLVLFGSLRVEAEILGLSVVATLAIGAAVMAAAGAAYGGVFQRAANDRRGGWLFGMAFGFLLWASGGALILPLASGGLAPAGEPPIGLLLSLLVWGTALGALFPFVHRPLHAGIEETVRALPARIGPNSASYPPSSPPSARDERAE